MLGCQLVESPALHEMSSIQNDHMIRFVDSVQTMRNGNNRGVG